MKTFGDVLESVETLSPDEQESLVDILQRRLREHRRSELAQVVKAARKEFNAGRCQPASPDDIMTKSIKHWRFTSAISVAGDSPTG